MGEWTWLHTVFPLADIELMQPPIDAKTANVLVRTVRRLPAAPTADIDKDVWYEVRVAPHNVAPFRGGPWLHHFRRQDLEHPGPEVAAFRAALAKAIAECQNPHGSSRTEDPM
ncbi:hypothetical protein [Alicyclobacillus herbarius]|uniref:hypothetical protein n=1 Tax=Alicyclobacillus herbarius TaxID=122960 RepID=UPI00047913FB|nr:hypothetical protein [Alicyclobacillus herbarius]